MLRKNQKGFTLIELLIVIVIIGILAGVLISIINPAQQQNRARDANVQATLNKVALSTEGFLSAYGRAPNDIEFLGSLSNSQDGDTSGTGDCDDDDTICLFSVTGNALPVGGTTDGCTAGGMNAWNGNSTAQCFFKYWIEDGTAAEPDTSHFRLYAKSFGIVGTVFMYDNKVGEINECVATTVADTVSTALNDANGPCL